MYKYDLTNKNDEAKVEGGRKPLITFIIQRQTPRLSNQIY